MAKFLAHLSQALPPLLIFMPNIYFFQIIRGTKSSPGKAFCSHPKGIKLVTIKSSPINNQFKPLSQLNIILKAILINLDLIGFLKELPN